MGPPSLGRIPVRASHLVLRFSQQLVSWFSLNWRTSFPELHLSGRPSPGIESYSLSNCSRLRREGLIAFIPKPKGGKNGRRTPSGLPPAPRSRPVGRPLGSLPSVALSSAQVALHDTIGQFAQAILFRPGSSHGDPRSLPGHSATPTGLRSRSAKITASRPANLSAGAT
jgi:hypothetical protein